MATETAKPTPPKPKLFRDPVHDIIALDKTDPVEQVVLQLIGTAEFQRLRRVRQLGLAYLVYPGAEHSRFQHSLGVLHIAHRMLTQIGQAQKLDPRDRLYTLAAALLHDIGHGPFSHAIEKTTQIHHEAVTVGLLLDPGSEVHQVLAAVDPWLPRVVADLIDVKNERSWRSDVISSQLDADRLDYILRDGHMTGVKIGVFDLERILSMIEPGEGSLVVNGRAKEAIEGYLIARFHMFKQVYLHKSTRAAEAMLESTLARAADLLAEGVEVGTPTAALERLLRDKTLPPREFIELDDMDIWVALKAWRRHDDPALAELADGLVRRRLFKTIDLDPTDEEQVADAVARAEEVVAAMGLSPRYHLRLTRAEDTPYRPYDPAAVGEQRPIMINLGGRLRRIEDVSDIAHLLGKDRYKSVRLCFPERAREAVADAVKGAERVG